MVHEPQQFEIVLSVFFFESAPLVSMVPHETLNGVVIGTEFVGRLLNHLLYGTCLMLLDGVLLFRLFLCQGIQLFLLFTLEFDKFLRSLKLVQRDRFELRRVVLFVLVPGG